MKNNYLISALMAAVILVGCDAVIPILDEPVAVRLSSTINETVIVNSTRVAGTSWGAGDKIGVFMLNDLCSVVVGADNRQYIIDNNGAFNSTTDIFYPTDGSKISLLAYYPYRDDVEIKTPLNIEIEDQTMQSSFDLLYAHANNEDKGYSKVIDQVIPLQFDHMLSKIVINVKAGANVSETLSGMTVTIKGTNTRNIFDLSTGILGSSTDVADIKSRVVKKDSLYDAIIMPGAYVNGAVSVEFKIGSDVFVWEIGEVEFLSGCEHIYNVTLDRGNVAATSSINGWTANDSKNVTANWKGITDYFVGTWRANASDINMSVVGRSWEPELLGQPNLRVDMTTLFKNHLGGTTTGNVDLVFTKASNSSTLILNATNTIGFLPDDALQNKTLSVDANNQLYGKLGPFDPKVINLRNTSNNNVGIELFSLPGVFDLFKGIISLFDNATFEALVNANATDIEVKIDTINISVRMTNEDRNNAEILINMDGKMKPFVDNSDASWIFNVLGGIPVDIVLTASCVKVN